MAYNKGDTWKLFYWPFAGRGEFVRLIFEEAGVEYDDVCRSSGSAEVVVKRKNDFGSSGPGYPLFAPPIVQKGEFALSQTGAIVHYLSGLFGLRPKSAEDDAIALQVTLSALDFVSEGRLSYHHANHTASYFTQQQETAPFIEEFKNSRMITWLNYFERCLKSNHNGEAFLVGNDISYADLVVFHALRAAQGQHPEKWKEIDNIPLLKAFKERMEKRPRLASYLASSRAQAQSGDSFM